MPQKKNNSLLIIFVKNPILGKAKTRLAKDIGDQNALEIYKTLLKHTRSVVHSLENTTKWIFYSDFINENDIWNHSVDAKFLQEGSDLGSRMKHAFQEGIKSGFESIGIIGSDNLELTPEILTQGFDLLKNCEVVFGPAKDGGYYFLGKKRMMPELFENINWSTNQVLEQSLASCKEKLTQLLPELSDIDTIKDLKSTKLWHESLSSLY